MELPTDNTDYPGLEMLGRFDPFEAKRLLKRFEEQHVSFKVKGCSEIRSSLTRSWRRNWVEIYIRPDHKKKADAIIIEGTRR